MKVINFFLIVGLVVLAGCYSTFWEHSEAIKKVQVAHVRAIFNINWMGVKTNYLKWGSGFVVDEHHILSARHIVKLDSVRVQLPFGVLNVPIEPNKIRIEGLIGNRKVKLKVEKESKERDLVLLYSKKKLECGSYYWGKMSRVKNGTIIGVLSRPYSNVGRVIKRGIVTSWNENRVIIDSRVVHGDSGGVVIAHDWVKGRWEVIGMVIARGGEKEIIYGVAVPVNRIKEFLQK